MSELWVIRMGLGTGHVLFFFSSDIYHKKEVMLGIHLWFGLHTCIIANSERVSIHHHQSASAVFLVLSDVSGWLPWSTLRIRYREERKKSQHCSSPRRLLLRRYPEREKPFFLSACAWPPSDHTSRPVQSIIIIELLARDNSAGNINNICTACVISSARKKALYSEKWNREEKVPAATRII